MSRKERKRDLEGKLNRQYQLLSEYEDKIDLSDEPKEITTAKLQVQKIKERIKEYQAELATLRPLDSIDKLLFESIKSVNYTNQRKFIFSYFSKWRPGLILIDGKENFGQSWFTNLVKEHYEQKKGTSFFEVPIQLETGVQENWITILSNLSFKFLGGMVSFNPTKQQEDVNDIIENITSRSEN